MLRLERRSRSGGGRRREGKQAKSRGAHSPFPGAAGLCCERAGTGETSAGSAPGCAECWMLGCQVLDTSCVLSAPACCNVVCSFLLQELGSHGLPVHPIGPSSVVVGLEWRTTENGRRNGPLQAN
ncbi:hypothetical protein HYQ46_003843 [Verticillium longisporum]|nr:hypothetical protein HYQ46_003843 [Verticillium longisporum]